MIISCPSCETSFKVDAASLGPAGRRVRCSKCGHVWHAEPDAGNAPAAPPPEPPVQDKKTQERPASRHEPVLTARDPDEGDDGDGDAAGPDGGAGEQDEIGTDGLTAKQRSKLAAARHTKKQPRGKRFWFKVLLVLLIVAGILAVVQRMLPKGPMKTAGPAVEQPANVAPVDAKPVPPETESDQGGGHIVGDPPPEPPKPAE